MPDTTTEHYEWVKPENGASADDWGIKWNDNLDDIDADLNDVFDLATGAQTTATDACAKAQNLNDVADKAVARSNLGLAIGTNVQAYNANLAAFAGLGNAAGQIAHFTGGTTMDWFPSTGYMRTLMNTADANAFRTALNLCQAGGTGASGTWSISITGSAAAATTAGTANALNTGNAYSMASLTVNGNMQANTIYSIGDIIAYASDDRLKIRRGSLENALDKVKSLDVFYYTFNDKGRGLGFDGSRHLGLSAQQVREVLPEASRSAPADSKFLTYQDRELIPLLVAGMQELLAKIARLEENRDASE